MSKPSLISVVLSFRNEEEVLPELIKRLENSLGPLKMEYELIFVNDASIDNSRDILEEKIKENKRIKLINMSRRFGISASVMAGIRHAKGDAVIYMDTDLQDPPELIPKLFKKWQEGYDIVYTTRTRREGEYAAKMWVTKLAYRVINLFSEIDLPLDSGDFKLLSRRAVNELIKLDEHDPFFRGLVHWVGFKQSRVFYSREKRFAGKTHFPLFGGGPLKAFVSGICSFSILPLNMALLIGFVVSFASFVYLIIVVIHKFLGLNLPGWSAIMVTMLFLGGVQLFTIGLLGIYLGRVYNEVKTRPNYIIESTIGFEK